MSSVQQQDILALDGGPKSIRSSLPINYYGANRVDKTEEEAILNVLRQKLFSRYEEPFEVEKRKSEAQKLEELACKKFGVKYAVAVTSGTAALITGLSALGVGPGDEVIVPGYTWVACAEAVLAVGAVPIIAEIDDSLTIDPDDIEKKITPHTKAIMPVHIRGRCCDMDRIMQIAKKHNLYVIEDTAQACGGKYHDRYLGTIGDIGTFSFHQKKLATCGEGGMVITNNKTLYERAVMLEDNVGCDRYHIEEKKKLWGVNFRIAELLAAMARVQLEHKLDGILRDNRQKYNLIYERIRDVIDNSHGHLQLCRSHCINGDCAIAMIFLLDDSNTARQVADALRAEGLTNAYVLFSPDVHDQHVYYHWNQILGERSWSEISQWKLHKREIRYSRDMCPKSLDILGRAVHIDINCDFTEQNITDISNALRKVFKHYTPPTSA